MNTPPCLSARVLGAACLWLAVSNAAAIPMVFPGADAGTGTTNSDSAFAAWQANVGGFVLDNLEGIGGASSMPGVGGFLLTDLGNRFTTTDDGIGLGPNFDFTVLEAPSMLITRVGSNAEFVWDVVVPVDAFGFFARGNSGGIVTISFDDGTAQQFSIQDLGGNGGNLFWGVSGLASPIDTVTISTTDPGVGSAGQNSFWDRFVYRAVVPEPASIALLAAGMLLMGVSRRRPG